MADVLTDVTRWEYSYLVSSTAGLRGMVATLNDLAAEGWELVTMDDVDRTLGMNALTAMLRRRIEPLPRPSSLDEGWYPDPAGRYDKRFWSGRAWTFHVARTADQTQHRDPPTALDPTPDLSQ